MCHIYCPPPGHFLFLPVRESYSLQEASIHSAAFPHPVSSAACQVSYLPDAAVEFCNLDVFVGDLFLSNHIKYHAKKLCFSVCVDADLCVPARAV